MNASLRYARDRLNLIDSVDISIIIRICLFISVIQNGYNFSYPNKKMPPKAAKATCHSLTAAKEIGVQGRKLARSSVKKTKTVRGGRGKPLPYHKIIYISPRVKISKGFRLSP